MSCLVMLLFLVTLLSIFTIGYNIMEIVEQLNAKLDRIMGDVGDVATEVAALRTMIEDLQNQEVIKPEDLQPALDKANAIEAGLDAIVPDPVVEEPPVEEPPVE